MCLTVRLKSRQRAKGPLSSLWASLQLDFETSRSSWPANLWEMVWRFVDKRGDFEVYLKVHREPANPVTLEWQSPESVAKTILLNTLRSAYSVLRHVAWTQTGTPKVYHGYRKRTLIGEAIFCKILARRRGGERTEVRENCGVKSSLFLSVAARHLV